MVIIKWELSIYMSAAIDVTAVLSLILILKYFFVK